MSTVSDMATKLPGSLTHWPGYLMTFIAEHATERFERELRADGIATRHATVLVVIDAEGPMSQSSLCRRLRIDKSPMVGVIDDLEALGLAVRAQAANDRRAHAISLTEPGRTLVRRIEKVADRLNERMFAALDGGERAQLQALLLRVAETH
jgi:DNA-binding MarR family transcriptional regulator